MSAAEGPRGKHSLDCGRPSGHGRIGSVTATILDGKATAAAIKAELPSGSPRCAEHGVVPGLGTVLVGDDPGSRSTSPASTATAPRSASPRSASTCPADATPGRRRGGRRASSTPTRRAPVTSSSCRCRTGSTPTASLELDGPGQGRRRAAPDQPRPARARAPRRRCRARPAASSSCCGATTSRSPAPRSCVVGRGVTVGRPLGPAAHPPQRERHRHPVPHRHRATWPRTPAAADIVVAAAGVAGPDHRRHGQARARPCSTSASRRTDAAGLRRRRRPRRARGRRVTSRRCPAASGPMTRAMLLTNVVEAAERAAGLAGDPRAMGAPPPRAADGSAAVPGVADRAGALGGRGRARRRRRRALPPRVHRAGRRRGARVLPAGHAAHSGRGDAGRPLPQRRPRGARSAGGVA